MKDNCIGMTIKQKMRVKLLKNDYRYFLESNFVGVNRFLVLIYSNEVNNTKRYGDKNYLSKGIIKNYNVIISGKNFCDRLLILT